MIYSKILALARLPLNTVRLGGLFISKQVFLIMSSIVLGSETREILPMQKICFPVPAYNTIYSFTCYPAQFSETIHAVGAFFHVFVERSDGRGGRHPVEQRICEKKDLC